MKLLLIVPSLFLVPAAFAFQTNLPQQTPTASIRGKILQEPGEQPIRKAKVQFNGQAGSPATQYSVVTDSEGQFAIDDMQPGKYVVVLERLGFVQPGRRLTTISAQKDTGKGDLIFHMQPAAVITGKILDADGDPMPRVSVSATRTGSMTQDSHDSGNGSTNDLGEFRISDLRSGRYKISANFPPQQPRTSDAKENNNEKYQSIYLNTYYPGVLDEDRAIPVEVRAGTEERITFSVLTGRAFHVRGTVTGIPSGDTGSALVLMLQGGYDFDMAAQERIGEDGKFEFANVLPGTYRAEILGFTFEGGRPGMQRERFGPLIEVSNADVEGLRLQPEILGRIRGKFRLDTTDEKFDWSQLTVNLLSLEEPGGVPLWGAGPQSSSSVNTDGTFEIKNVSGGVTNQLEIAAKSNALRDYFTKSVSLGGRDVTDSNFQVVVPETFLDVMVSANGATVSGTVVDTNGEPVANAIVEDVPSVEHRSRQDLYQRDSTDASGHFSLRGLSPGKYTVFAFEESQQDVRQPEFLKTYETRGEIVQLDEGARKSVILKLISSEGDAQ